MEQSGISIISPTGITENSVGCGKSKSIGITFRSNSGIQAAKEKLKSPWLANLMKEEASIWDTIILALGEAIGTAILVFLGCMGCVGSLGVTPPLMQVSLTFGLAVMTAIQCVGHISGAHINPAITLAALILGKISLPMSLLYVVAQCLGGATGYGLLKIITPSGLLNAGPLKAADSFCMTDLHSELTVTQGLLAEVIATGVLAMFACGAWDYRNARNVDSVAIRFGLCVGVMCFTFVPYTGCSMNPARTLGPAIWNGYWTHHWIYWLGPLGGAAISSVFYRCFFLANTSLMSPRQDTGALSGVET